MYFPTVCAFGLCIKYLYNVSVTVSEDFVFIFWSTKLNYLIFLTFRNPRTSGHSNTERNSKDCHLYFPTKLSITHSATEYTEKEAKIEEQNRRAIHGFTYGERFNRKFTHEGSVSRNCYAEVKDSTNKARHFHLCVKTSTV